MEHQDKVDELFRRLNAGEAAVQPLAPSIAEGVGRVSTVRINLRGWVETALQRLQSSDLAIGVHAASTGGGGRITSVAALIGICVSGVGAGTYCVATALLPDPKPAIRSEPKPAKRKASPSRRAPKTNTTASTSRAPSKQPGGVSGSRATAAQTPKTVPKSTRRESRARPDEFSFETGTRPTGSQPTSPPQASSAATARTASTGGFESGSTTRGTTSGGEFGSGTGGEFSP